MKVPHIPKVSRVSAKIPATLQLLVFCTLWLVICLPARYNAVAGIHTYTCHPIPASYDNLLPIVHQGHQLFHLISLQQAVYLLTRATLCLGVSATRLVASGGYKPHVSSLHECSGT